VTTLGRHNCHLTAVKDEAAVDKWTGDVEAHLFEELLEGDDRMSHIWRSWLTVPQNVPVEFVPGDQVVFTWNGTSHLREVRDIDRGRTLFGIIRLHFADR
jgi:hypothetical protein